MNEQLEKRLTDLATKAINGLEQGADWISGQIPDVIHQVLLWHMVKSLFIAVLLLALIATFVVIWVRGYRSYRRKEPSWFCIDGYSDCFPGVLSGVVGGCISGGLAFDVFYQALNALQIWLAPKVWLIEYIAELSGVKK